QQQQGEAADPVYRRAWRRFVRSHVQAPQRPKRRINGRGLVELVISHHPPLCTKREFAFHVDDSSGMKSLGRKIVRKETVLPQSQDGQLVLVGAGLASALIAQRLSHGGGPRPPILILEGASAPFG